MILCFCWTTSFIINSIYFLWIVNFQKHCYLEYICTFWGLTPLYIVTTSFIGGGNCSTQRKPLTCWSSPWPRGTYMKYSPSIWCVIQSNAENEVSNVHNGPSWLWSYGNWIYNYLCNRYIFLYLNIL
jgi:hypothetical protein